MPVRMIRGWRLLVLLCLVVMPLLPGTAGAEPFDLLPFRKVWQRTDYLVQQGHVPRTWLWGPAPGFSAYEPYAESEGGRRFVQYFEKSRMEFSFPFGPAEYGYVTNGLIVRELATGQLQVGHAAFEPRAPAEVPVAGDVANNPQVPTYADFGRFDPSLGDGQRQLKILGQPVTAIWIDQGTAPDGSNPALADTYPETATGFYDEVTGINIPGVFWNYFQQPGAVLEQGRRVQAEPLFDRLYVVGHPISGAYWTRARLGGQERPVLVQLFERRVLTYTPSNPAGWKVEMGNVGSHYVAWRYGRVLAPSGTDCSSVELVAPESPEGQAILAKLLVALRDWGSIPEDNEVREAYAIDRLGSWLVVQAAFTRVDPGILVMREGGDSYEIQEAVGGHFADVKRLRSAITREIPEAPAPLIGCLAPAPTFVGIP